MPRWTPRPAKKPPQFFRCVECALPGGTLERVSDEKEYRHARATSCTMVMRRERYSPFRRRRVPSKLVVGQTRIWTPEEDIKEKQERRREASQRNRNRFVPSMSPEMVSPEKIASPFQGTN